MKWVRGNLGIFIRAMRYGGDTGKERRIKGEVLIKEIDHEILFCWKEDFRRKLLGHSEIQDI